MLIDFIENDRRIFIRDEDSWELKGRYSKAILFRDPLLWKISDLGDHSIEIVAVSPRSLIRVIYFYFVSGK